MEEQESKISSYIEQHEDLKSTVSTSNGNGCTMPPNSEFKKILSAVNFNHNIPFSSFRWKQG